MQVENYINKKEKQLTAYLSFRGFEKQLACELDAIIAQYDRLILTEGAAQKTYWAQNIWFDTEIVKIESIGKAANFLRQLQRNWYPHHIACQRRAELIKEKLPKVHKKRLEYPSRLPSGNLGSFSLLDNETMIFSTRCSQPLPDGEMEFIEDKVNPPSRAYLKLWEVFTRYNAIPQKGDNCLELGASPGGWSWVILNTGANLLAIDRSPLQRDLMSHKNLRYEQGDAFKYLPDKIKRPQWIFSDLICYPEKLYQFISEWLIEASDTNFICTIKFQGEEHYSWAERFEKIPGSKVVHLYHNKHEFTWINLAKDRKQNW